MSSERTVTIVPEAGLHARPAAKFVETVNEHDSDVRIGYGDDEPISAGSMIAVTSLGAESGEDVRLIADGPDEEAALDALERVLTTPEDELADAEG
ncbi:MULTISPECIES: HPr family phosphocarrier protein [Natronococcus]|uniref:Phosphocarrier protein Hpr n=1 Tax=Natronococcus jeotgali DSM 18795 TaxID=1227498 RepID=L9X3M9_9EURY|nr:MULTISPECIES: HPr family phosphocarrier protein [Natronococcus]ELY56374.1 phosphocarrier protein Hpr [Natronococcus jeotgali DSM 18795]NKE37723.1 HPr family phosphocarrier protein [Natronococcus sp. JC468]